MGLFDRAKRRGPSEPATGAAAPPITVQVGIQTGADVVPVEARTRSAQLDRGGLYPHEILMLSYAHLYHSTEHEFPGFWWYRYGVRAPGSVLASLADRGFLDLGGIEQTVGRHTVAALKQVLVEHDLKVSGKKAELIQRVLGSVPQDALSQLYPERFYVLTQSGRDALEASEHIPYIHQNQLEGLDIFSLTTMVNAHPGRSYRDLLWGYLNEQSMVHAQASDWGLYRNTRFAMAEFLVEENKLLDALGMMAEVVYYDVSGMGNSFSMRHLDVTAQNLFPYERSLAKTAPGIITRIFEWKDRAGLSDEELRTLVLQRLARLNSPLRLFTADECADIVFLEFAENKQTLTALYGRAEQLFRATYRV